MTNKVPVSTTMRTDLLSEVLTEHKNKIGALKPGCEFIVTSINGNDKTTVAHGYIREKDII